MSDQLLLILFGWALGFLSTLATDGVRGWKMNASFRHSIKAELSDAQYFAITSAYLIKQKLGAVTPEFAQKVAAISEAYEQWDANDPRRVANNALLKLNEEEMIAMSHRLNQGRKRALALKSVELPFTYANLDKVSALPGTDQKTIFEVFRRVKTLNQIVLDLREKNALTFDSSLSGDNYALVVKDIDDYYEFAAGQYEALSGTVT
jgi:hypothetical protein